MHLRNALSLWIAAGALAAITIIPASAQVLNITITDGTTTLTVADGSALDTDATVGTVTVGKGLTDTFANLATGSTVSAAFSLPGGTLSELDTNGNLKGTNNSLFTVTSSINGVTVPSGLVRMFNDTNTIAFNLSPIGTNGNDTNGVSTANVLFGQNLADTTFSYNSTTTSPNSGSGTGPGFIFVNTGAFAITSVTKINTVNNAAGLFTTTSILQAAAVPEPGTVALLSSLGVCGTAFGLRRLRRRK
jgi:hypothetical protein